jgi:hypothetical protein
MEALEKRQRIRQPRRGPQQTSAPLHPLVRINPEPIRAVVSHHPAPVAHDQPPPVRPAQFNLAGLHPWFRRTQGRPCQWLGPAIGPELPAVLTPDGALGSPFLRRVPDDHDLQVRRTMLVPDQTPESPPPQQGHLPLPQTGQGQTADE